MTRSARVAPLPTANRLLRGLPKGGVCCRAERLREKTVAGRATPLGPPIAWPPPCMIYGSMTEVEADQLKHAVENMHGGSATLAQMVSVRETFRGQAVWEGVVYVFDLESHPKATRAYAWSSPIEGSEKRRFFAVLHTGLIKSPTDAVRAAIVAEHRASKGG